MFTAGIFKMSSFRTSALFCRNGTIPLKEKILVADFNCKYGILKFRQSYASMRKNRETWFQSPQEIRHQLQIGFIRILEKPIEISFYLILRKMIKVICGTLIPTRNKMMFYGDVSTKNQNNPDINLFYPFSFHRTTL